MKFAKYLISASISFLSTFIWSQSTVNFQYGQNIASVKTNDLSKVLNEVRKPIIGHHIQATLEHNIAKNLNVSIGLGYREKGFQIDETSNLSILNIPIPIGGRIVTDIKSIEIPVTAKYHLPLQGANTYILIGGGYSFNINSKLKPYASILGDFALPGIEITNTINNNEIYGTIGAGVSHAIGQGKIFGEAALHQSFENYTSKLFIDVPLKNRSFTVGIGYSMPIN